MIREKGKRKWKEEERGKTGPCQFIIIIFFAKLVSHFLTHTIAASPVTPINLTDNLLYWESHMIPR